MRPFRLEHGAGGAGALPLTDYIDAYVLVAATNKACTAPSPTGVKTLWACFSANCDFYIERGAAAVVPVADVTDGTASKLNPYIVSMEPGTAFALISTLGGIVTIDWYSQP